MSIPLIVLGVLIVVVVIVDFLTTTISLRAQGALTKLVSRAIGGLTGWLGGPFARFGGPITLSSLAAFWVLVQWIGWALIFYGSRRHLSGPDGHPDVGVLDSFAFAGSALSTMGLGVVTPGHPVLHLAAVLASVFGILVLTLSVTFVLNVSGVAVTSRSMALQLRDLAHVTAAMEGLRERANYLLGRSEDLGATLHSVADRRESFSLAQLYEVRGSERDVAMRAERLQELVVPAIDAVASHHQRVQLELLRNALGRLTR